MFRRVEDTDACIDDLVAFTRDDWNNHVKLLDQMLGLLTKHGFTVSPSNVNEE